MFRIMRPVALVAAVVIAAPAALAQSTPSTPAASSSPPGAAAASSTTTAPVTAAPAPARHFVPAGTIIEIALVDAVSTKTAKQGDKFAIELVSPISLDGAVLVPAGTRGVGQVVDSQPPGSFGKPAKLSIAARYLELNGAQIPLKATKLAVRGQDNTAGVYAASWVPYAGILAGAIPGGGTELAAGTHAFAKLASDLDAPASTPPPPPTSTPTTPTSTPTPKSSEEGKPQ
jgi:hypothetical protein